MNKDLLAQDLVAIVIDSRGQTLVGENENRTLRGKKNYDQWTKGWKKGKVKNWSSPHEILGFPQPTLHPNLFISTRLSAQS